MISVRASAVKLNCGQSWCYETERHEVEGQDIHRDSASLTHNARIARDDTDSQSSQVEMPYPTTERRRLSLSTTDKKVAGSLKRGMRILQPLQNLSSKINSIKQPLKISTAFSPPNRSRCPQRHIRASCFILQRCPDDNIPIDTLPCHCLIEHLPVVFPVAVGFAGASLCALVRYFACHIPRDEAGNFEEAGTVVAEG